MKGARAPAPHGGQTDFADFENGFIGCWAHGGKGLCVYWFADNIFTICHQDKSKIYPQI